ncbi:MAG: hypothetical protein JWM89_1996 [Acidimicrobiales bacterium]|nr:hypothetical protein [Acidimicrobiales bacterium]
MQHTNSFSKILHAASDRCGEPITAAVLAVRGPATGGVGPNRMFGRSNLAKELKILNLIALTATHVRLFTLGGRTGLKPKDEIGAWPLGAVQIQITDADRSSYYASTMSTIDYQVHVVRLLADGVDLAVDVMADTESNDVVESLQAFLWAVHAAGAARPAP